MEPIAVRRECVAEENRVAVAWLRGIANGDRQAFRALHDRYENLIFATIHKVLNERLDSEDVMQEVMALIWRKAGQYDASKGHPSTWLATLARNRAIDRLRWKQRRAELRDEYEAERTTLGPTDRATAVDEIVLRRDRCRQVRAAVEGLNPAQRQAIELAFFGGKTQKEIAQALNQPLGTVKARIRRGVFKLRELVGDLEALRPGLS